MTPSDERDLYERDRPAWIEWVAPRMAKRIDDYDDGLLAAAWATMPRDYQRATWGHMTGAQRERVRAVRENGKEIGGQRE